MSQTNPYGVVMSVAIVAIFAALSGCKKSSQICAQVQCNPPPCCGDSCGTGGSCCDGTVCSADNVCVPTVCTLCEETECKIDLAQCSGQCVISSGCCNRPCASQSECCPGTFCDDRETPGQGTCVPADCALCVGSNVNCVVLDGCEVSCQPPAACGFSCASDEDCDFLTSCFEFPSGDKACIPSSARAMCESCGSGCRFDPVDCRIDCRSVTEEPADAGAVADARPMPDAGPISDAGVPADASPAADAFTRPDALPAGSCKGCCGACVSDSDCCPGSFCGALDGKKVCTPEECRACGENGCIFECP